MRPWSWAAREMARREMGCTYTELDEQPADDVLMLMLYIDDRNKRDKEMAMLETLDMQEARLQERYRRLGVR